MKQVRDISDAIAAIEGFAEEKDNRISQLEKELQEANERIERLQDEIDEWHQASRRGSL